MPSHALTAYDFATRRRFGLFVAAGGFEERSTAFLRRLDPRAQQFDSAIFVQYDGGGPRDEENLARLNRHASRVHIAEVQTICVDASTPVWGAAVLSETVLESSRSLANQDVVIDISGLTRAWALTAIHSAVSAGARVTVIYTEAQIYY